MAIREGSLGRAAAALAGLAALACGAGTAAAEAGDAAVEATYYATLGGFSVGSGTLTFNLGSAGDYRAALGAQVTGFASLVSNRSAQASAAGRAAPGSTLSRSYSLAINGGAVPNVVNMAFAGGSVSNVSATELNLPGNRVPLTAAHKRNVVDPLGAFVLTMPSAKDTLTPKVCNRTLRVFDGRVRYDLRLVYGAKTEVRGGAGSYAGPAIVCAVNYRPIAGFRQLSAEQQNFERNMEFSIWFVPVGSTNVVIPYKVVVGTPMGLLTVTASRFQVSGSRTANVGASAPAEPEFPIRD